MQSNTTIVVVFDCIPFPSFTHMTGMTHFLDYKMYPQRNIVVLSPPFCLLILGTVKQEKLTCIGQKLFSFFSTILLNTLFNSTNI